MDDWLTFEAFTQQTPIPPEPNAYLTRQGRIESNARFYLRRIPLALKKARGILFEKGQELAAAVAVDDRAVDVAAHQI